MRFIHQFYCQSVATEFKQEPTVSLTRGSLCTCGNRVSKRQLQGDPGVLCFMCATVLTTLHMALAINLSSLKYKYGAFRYRFLMDTEVDADNVCNEGTDMIAQTTEQRWV